LGAAAMILSLAGPAGATVVPSANSIIIASGGNTPYDAISNLADLFNQSQGCNILVPKGQTQPYDFSCPSGGSLPSGNPPTGYGLPSVGSPYSENPQNDVVAIEPSINSSAGITQLENQGAHTTNTAAINFASSANAEKSTDDSGMNYVAYAAGAVDYVVFTKVGSKKTPASYLKHGLSQAQLQAIWAGTDKCWGDVGVTGKDADDLIDPYSVYTSSAITSTWDAFLSPDNSETYVDAQTSWPPVGAKCLNGKAAVYTGPTFSNYASSHTIQQNELKAITSNGDQNNAIDFISYGRYNEQAKSTTFAGSALGSINNGSSTISPTETTILNGSWPVVQFLYNVYSDGSNSNIPVATPATLNFASEDGFICKPNTVDGSASGTQIVDPISGLTYRSEIETAITNSGFYPLDGLNENVPFAEEGAAVTTPASSISSFTSSNYYQYDTLPVNGSNQPLGYCLVTTSDANTGH
jgi:hypothetical protein